MFVEGREREKERAEELDGGLEVSGGEWRREKERGRSGRTGWRIGGELVVVETF